MELTTDPCGTTAALAPNSEVLLDASVAVAVIASPTDRLTAPGTVRSQMKVVTIAGEQESRYQRPSPCRTDRRSPASISPSSPVPGSPTVSTLKTSMVKVSDSMLPTVPT